MNTTLSHAAATPIDEPYRRIWAELTGKCQLSCSHCYADSGPDKGHGTMGADDWMGLIDQAAADGISMIQFIGGEPTMAPRFPEIMSHALRRGLDVEVYSNLVHVTEEMWGLFQSPGVNLAFSYYAKDALAHDLVTGRPSHRFTRRNAQKAVRLGIPIRAGVIDFGHAEDAVEDLKSIGIANVKIDRIRGIGRGADGAPGPAELCGRCGHNVVAVNADGDVSPCVFSRWLTVGNVLHTPLSEILSSTAMEEAMKTIPSPRGSDECRPDCDPNLECNPGVPSSECDPRN